MGMKKGKVNLLACQSTLCSLAARGVASCRLEEMMRVKGRLKDLDEACYPPADAGKAKRTMMSKGGSRIARDKRTRL